MIKMKNVDLTQLISGADKLIHLAGEHDPHWAGIQTLKSFGSLQLADNARNDIYLIEGELLIEGTSYSAGSFIGRDQGLHVEAGCIGATFFWYSDASFSGNESVLPTELQWVAGRLAGIHVAQLSLVHHSLSLVSWQAGTHTSSHSHPDGEEIFVVRGELCDELGRHGAGTWLRFYPDATHSPYAETDTLILLRNGHLIK